MKALVTGASSGIGRDMAIYLSKIGYDIILVARNEDKLIDVKEKLDTPSDILIADLNNKDDVDKVIDRCKKIKLIF